MGIGNIMKGTAEALIPERRHEMQKIPDARKTHIILTYNQISKLDEIGERFKISRSEALRRIVETGLDAYTVYEGLGVVKMAEIAKRVSKAIQNDVQPNLYRV